MQNRHLILISAVSSIGVLITGCASETLPNSTDTRQTTRDIGDFGTTPTGGTGGFGKYSDSRGALSDRIMGGGHGAGNGSGSSSN
jgi:hypothetical protein